jgi:hypothetical protein
MGTRSDIIVQRTDGKWHRIYCHWDGYLSHNGKLLFENYNSQKKAEALVAKGDMSSLGEKYSKPKGHTFDKPVNGYTVYYGRDRGEKDVGGTIADTLAGCWPEQDTWTEFTYVWVDGKWWVGDPDEGTQTLIELEAALKGEKKLRPLIKSPMGVLGRHTGEIA